MLKHNPQCPFPGEVLVFVADNRQGYQYILSAVPDPCFGEMLLFVEVIETTGGTDVFNI